jgi:hypothetical protein
MKTFLRKMITTLLLSFSAIFLLVQTAYAQSSWTDIFIYEIRNTTYAILAKMNESPAYIEEITKMAMSWNSTEDPTQSIPNNQYAFSMLDANYNALAGQQVNLAKDLTKQMLYGNVKENEEPTLPKNANELNYPTILGQMIADQGNTSQENLTKSYINNTSGVTFIQEPPSKRWRDTETARKYASLYNSLSAIKSFNAYVLTGLSNQKDTDKLNGYLTDQASNSTWFGQVASEPLGMVFRQMLMYNSQIYVQLNRMMKLQQQMLYSQAMANTLTMIQLQQVTGELLYQRAQQTSI